MSNFEYDLVKHIERQRIFSLKAFGDGMRTNGIAEKNEKENKEIEQNPTDLEEQVDRILLSIDGAWRAGHEPAAIAQALEAKLTKNENRKWPDWRTSDPNKAIEHIKEVD